MSIDSLITSAGWNIKDSHESDFQTEKTVSIEDLGLSDQTLRIVSGYQNRALVINETLLKRS